MAYVAHENGTQHVWVSINIIFQIFHHSFAFNVNGCGVRGLLRSQIASSALSLNTT